MLQLFCYTAIPPGIIADLGPQAICVENSDRSASVLANCITHRCVQVEGSDLMAFSLTINGMCNRYYNVHDRVLLLVFLFHKVKLSGVIQEER